MYFSGFAECSMVYYVINYFPIVNVHDCPFKNVESLTGWCCDGCTGILNMKYFLEQNNFDPEHEFEPWIVRA